MESLPCSNSVVGHQIGTHFCTRHVSCAAVPCIKFYSDRYFRIEGEGETIFPSQLNCDWKAVNETELCLIAEFEHDFKGGLLGIYCWYFWDNLLCHYNDVILGAMASEITGVSIVCSTVYSGEDQGKHQSSASLAFVRGIHRWLVNFPHKRPVTRKMLPIDDVIMAMMKSNYMCHIINLFWGVVTKLFAPLGTLHLFTDSTAK